MEGPSASALEAHGYYTLGCIGRGSQGAVYTVRHLETNRTYVLKRMHIMEPEHRRTALLEAETLQRLQHTAVIGYRDTFVDDEHLCLVMEYGDGGDLGTRILNATRPFPEDQVLSWFAQLALALHHVHERGVLHRDLKTQNVFLTAHGHVKLGDFGIAKLLASNEPLAATCVGTPYYMPPEQFKGETYGTKADVWALGCILYEILTRRRAFQAPNLNSLTQKVLRGDYGPLPPSYSQGVHDLVRSLLTVQEAARPSLSHILSLPILRRHIAEFGTEALGNTTEAQQLANSALATLRAQLIPLGLHSLVNRTGDAPAAAANGERSAGGAGSGARHRRSLSNGSDYGGGSARYWSDSDGSGTKEDLRVESARQRLEEERRWRQRERRACRSLGQNQGTISTGTHPTKAGGGGGAGGGGAALAAAPEEMSSGMHWVGRPAALDGLELDLDFRAARELEQLSPPSPVLGRSTKTSLAGAAGAGLGETYDNYDWNGAAFALSRAALHGRRAGAGAPPRYEYPGNYMGEPEHLQEQLPPPMAHGADPSPPSSYDVPGGHAEDVHGGCMAAGGGDEASLMGLSARDRVLARRELRRRQEAEQHEGDLMQARQRYFQERVLADHAQRSQYLGSFVPGGGSHGHNHEPPAAQPRVSPTLASCR